jgi:Carbohydrate family 9 binding domain-like
MQQNNKVGRMLDTRFWTLDTISRIEHQASGIKHPQLFQRYIMLKNLFILIILSTTICMSQTLPIPRIKFNPKKYICYKTNEQITIDGKLNETSWSIAEWTDDFVDIEGSVKPAPRFRTRAKMLWDDNYLFIAAQIDEPDIWATLTQRDTVIFYDNDFEVFIDPDGDTHRYSEFEMNALNTVWDLLLIEPYRDTKNAPVNGWDIHGLKTAVSINGTLNKPGDKDKNWTVELAFPFKAVPPKDGDQWRLNFSRVEWKTEVVDGKYKKQINPATGKPYPEDNWVWSPQGVVNMHYPEMWGYIQFSINEVGTETASFIEKNEEAAKWYLRQIYYKERNYFAEHGEFTTDLKKLGIEDANLKDYNRVPSIECTPSLFEAWLQSRDGSETVHIRNDGLTWITKN